MPAYIRTESPKTTVLSQHPRRRRAPLLSPDLTKAVKDLAASEGLPLATFVTVLINEGLTRRMRSHS
jgi:hypothetical protein